MKITKFGQCCLLIEENGVRLITDPGSLSTNQNEAENIDAILITHEHEDHLHMDSLKAILKKNPDAIVITNTAVAKLLDEAGISYQLIGHEKSLTIKGLVISALEAPHAEIYKTMPRVLNTGFFIAEKLFYPGDAFIVPSYAVDILALPVAGPWMKSSEAIEYALAVKPRVAFPVHDAIMKSPAFAQRLPGMILPKEGIEFRVIEIDATEEF